MAAEARPAHTAVDPAAGVVAAVGLLACQARELAFELLELAEQADRERTNR